MSIFEIIGTIKELSQTQSLEKRFKITPTPEYQLKLEKNSFLVLKNSKNSEFIVLDANSEFFVPGTFLDAVLLNSFSKNSRLQIWFALSAETKEIEKASLACNYSEIKTCSCADAKTENSNLRTPKFIEIKNSTLCLTVSAIGHPNANG